MREASSEDERGDGERCLSLREASGLLRVCDRTLRREIARGRLKAFHVGRSVRVRFADLRAYMSQGPIGVHHV